MPKIRILEKDVTSSVSAANEDIIILIADAGYNNETPYLIAKSSDSLIDTLTNGSFVKKVLNLGGKVYVTNQLSNAQKYVTDRNQYNITFIYADQDITKGDDGVIIDNTSEVSPLKIALDICNKRRDCSVVYTKALPEYSEAEQKLLKEVVSGDEFLAQEKKDALGKYVLPFYAKNLASDHVEVKAGFGYILAFLNSISNGNSAYKPAAGYQRGIIPISGLSIGLLTEDEIDNMQPRKKGISINPIVNLSCLGENTIRILGDRTALPLPTAEGDADLVASSFASIRVMLNAIKKKLYIAGRKYQFETNDDILWINYRAFVNKLLDEMKSAGCIRSYEWFKLETTEKAKICAKLVVSPVEPVEDFDLTIELQDEDTTVSE